MAREKIENIDWCKMQQAMVKKKMTMRSLSEKLGYDNTYLAHRKTMGWLWSNGLELIAELLGVDYKELLISEEPTTEEPNQNNDMDKYIIEQFGEIRAMISMQNKLINALADDLIVLHREIKQYRG